MAGMKDSSKVNKEVWETFQGTFTYMSPERIKGQAHSFDSDIWAIGLTIVTCGLGKFPFELKEFTIWEMMKYLENKKLVDMLPKNNFSEEMMQFISACLSFDPKDRPLAKDLLKYDWIVKNKKTKPSIGNKFHFSNFIF
jgi:serine/threonine protein kinase